MPWYSVVRTIFIALLFLAGHQAQSASAYSNYIADVYLLESHQARDPDQIIRYADEGKGAVLRTVMDLSRAKAALAVGEESMKRSGDLPDLNRFLVALSVRYDEAFTKDPRSYEAEYLDSMEIQIEVNRMLAAVQEFAFTGLRAQKSASAKQPSSDPKSAVVGEKLKAVVEAIPPLLKHVRDIYAAINKARAQKIRDQVAKGMFTDIGQKRALTIADSLAP